LGTSSWNAESHITDAGLVHLKELPELETLDLTWTAVGNEGLKHLKGSKHLKNLGLHGTRVTGAGLEALVELPELGGLQLSERQVDLDCLKKIKKLSNLLIYLQAIDDLKLKGLNKLQAALPGCPILFIH
jgi:hypothetical protein